VRVSRNVTNDSARDVRAADLQEETVIPVIDMPSPCPKVGFTGSDEDRGNQRTSQRAERAIRQSARCASATSNKWVKLRSSMS
jgi:hypothetical protein